MATPKNKPSAEQRLKRFLYLSTEDPRFITGNPEIHKYYTTERAKAVTELIQANKIETILNIIEIVNSENVLPRRATLFFVLAIVARTKLIEVPESLKRQIYTVTLNTVKSSEDFFMFIRFCTQQQRSFPSALNRFISSYYLQKEPLELAKEVTRNNGLHSWTHKDLLKLSHCKTKDKVVTAVLSYIFYDLKKAESAAEGVSEAEDILKYLRKINELKRCESDKRIAELVSELHCSINRVPSFYHNSQTVWEALLPILSLKELILALPKLYKLGFLKANTTFQAKVVEMLTDNSAIKSSKIHPVEVFLGLRNFEKGGKPLDPKFLKHLEKKAEEMKVQDPNYKKPDLTSEAPKCPAVISALHKVMQSSFHNLQPTGRRIMITIEASEKMNEPCLHSKNISCLDAAVILTLSLLRVEKEVIVATFSDDHVDLLSFEKNITLNQALGKLKNMKGKCVSPSAPFEWAQAKKKSIDVFINFFYSTHCFTTLPKEVRDKEKPLNSLSSYRKKMSLPNTKLISFSLSSHRLALAGNLPNTLDICGFSIEVPKLVEAFSRGLFN